MDHTASYDKDKMSKLFTTGNSEAIRLRKKDTELLDLNPSDQFIKEISLDGRSISYNKFSKISQENKKEIANILNEDSDLIWALKDL